MERKKVNAVIKGTENLKYDQGYETFFTEYLATGRNNGFPLTDDVKALADRLCPDNTNPMKNMRALFDEVSSYLHYRNPKNKDIRSSVNDDEPVDRSKHRLDLIVEEHKQGNLNNHVDSSTAGSSEHCLQKKGGGCTDLHTLLVTMARYKGIPSRIQFGSRLPNAGGEVVYGEDKIPGYRCIVEFYAPGFGWVPIDAAQAGNSSVNSKGEELPNAKEIRDSYFSGMDNKRVSFFEGRNVKLATGNPDEEGPQVNLFIGAYALVDQKPHKGFLRTMKVGK
jgi:hypothetical protein